MTLGIDRNAGFTLVEMLIAFLILSTALVAANQSISSAVKAFSTTRDIRAADRLASEVLVEHLDGQGTLIGPEVGRSPDGYAWRIGRSLLPGGEGGGQVVRVSVGILNPQGELIRTYVTYFAASKSEQANGGH